LSGTGAPDFYNGTELMLAWRIVDNRNGMRWSLYSILATTKHRSNHANVSIKSGYVRKVTIGKIQIRIVSVARQRGLFFQYLTKSANRVIEKLGFSDWCAL
jgi:hypothetical protein